MTGTSLIGPSFDPNGVYVGALRVGRTCYDHAGRRLTVVSQGTGSTLISRTDEPVPMVISQETVVYTSPQEVPV